MLGLLPFLALALLSFSARKAFCRETTWREAILFATALWGALLVLATELLSLFRALSFGPLLIFWILVCAINLLYMIRDGKKLSFIAPLRTIPQNLQAIRLSILECICLAAIIFILLGTGITAFVAPPNNWDSMTYHMSRVMHWVQNQTVANYPTAIPRQLYYMPFAEYVIAHLQILACCDRFANMVQWLSLLGCVLTTTLIAHEINLIRRFQLLTALFVVTVPMAVLQASSTQNDLVLSFWGSGFVYFLFRLKRNFSLKNIWACGLFGGIALLTKGTFFLFLPSFLILWMPKQLKRGAPRARGSGETRPQARGPKGDLPEQRAFLPGLCPTGRSGEFCEGIKEILRVSLTAGIIMLAVNCGFYLRQAQLWHLGLSANQDNVINQDLSPAGFISILIRNIGSEMASPLLPLNDTISKGVLSLHQVLSINPVDPRTSFSPIPYLLSNHVYHDDNSGNALPMITIALCLVLYLIKKSWRASSGLRDYFTLFLIITFFYTLLLKWQPWGMRLHLPLFILAGPFIAAVWEQTARRSFLPLTALFFVCALPWLLWNEARPILGKNSIFTTPRVQQYFANQKGYPYSYLQAARQISREQCSQVGLVIGADSWEYPLWAVLAQQEKFYPRIEHVDVNGPLKDVSYPRGRFEPCVLILDGRREETQLVLDEQTFFRKRRLPFLTVFQSAGTDPTTVWMQFNEALAASHEFLGSLAALIQDLRPSAPESERVIRSYQKFLTHCQGLDIQALNTRTPGLGDAFQQKLQEGLRNLFRGLTQNDRKAYLEGQGLLNEWRDWMGAHRIELQKN